MKRIRERVSDWFLFAVFLEPGGLVRACRRGVAESMYLTGYYMCVPEGKCDVILSPWAGWE